MDAQQDLFGVTIPMQEPAAIRAQPEPLAAPCGYRNRRNAPCLRLAHVPLRVDGRQMRSGGRPLLRCDMRCFDQPGEAEVQAELTEGGEAAS